MIYYDVIWIFLLFLLALPLAFSELTFSRVIDKAVGYYVIDP